MKTVQTAFAKVKWVSIFPVYLTWSKRQVLLSFTDEGCFFFLHYLSIEENNANHSFVSDFLYVPSFQFFFFPFSVSLSGRTTKRDWHLAFKWCVSRVSGCVSLNVSKRTRLVSKECLFAEYETPTRDGYGNQYIKESSRHEAEYRRTGYAHPWKAD